MNYEKQVTDVKYMLDSIDGSIFASSATKHELEPYLYILNGVEKKIQFLIGCAVTSEKPQHEIMRLVNYHILTHNYKNMVKLLMD